MTEATKKAAVRKPRKVKSDVEKLQDLVAKLRADGWTVDGRVDRLNDGVSEGVNL
jgi:hypothetical protein